MENGDMVMLIQIMSLKDSSFSLASCEQTLLLTMPIRGYPKPSSFKDSHQGPSLAQLHFFPIKNKKRKARTPLMNVLPAHPPTLKAAPASSKSSP